MSGLIQISCPDCRGLIDVQRDWDGCDGECPHCHNVFRICIPKVTEDSQVADLLSRVATISDSELLWVVDYFTKVLNGKKSSDYSSIESRARRVLNEVQRRKKRAKESGDAETKRALPFPLRLFAFLICKYRKPTQQEQFLSNLEWKTYGVMGEADRLLKNEEMEKHRNEVRDYAALVHRRRDIPPVNYPHMSYQQNEHPCLVMKNVDGVSCSKVGEAYYGGTLVVTNKRVFFISPTHQQVYRLHNLIEYFSNWDYYNGTIKLSSSERRSEQYQMPGVWKAAFVISFFCDPMFRQSILQGTEGQAKAAALSKVEASITRGASYSGNTLEVKTDGRRRSNDNYDPFKNYVDVSEKGLIGGMCAAFSAGLHGKGIITGWDKMTWYKPKGRRN